MQKADIMKNYTSEEDIEKINHYTRRKLSADEVYTFKLRLCDNEIDRDYECFTAKTLNELAKLFKGKTGIFDHSMKSSDQKARIYDTYVEVKNGQKTSYGEPLSVLNAKAYMLKNEKNSELIEEIDAGIKKEVSVSCSIKKSICSICGTDKRSAYCEHIAGKKYANKLCFKKLEGAQDAYEFSFVAVPAQREAGVTKAFKIGGNLNLNETVNKIKSCSGGIELDEKQAKSLGKYIENLEEEAKISRSCKEELSREVAGMFFKSFPDMDRQVIASVTGIMTFEELKSFKNYFSKKKKALQPQIPLNDKKTQKTDYSQFRI